MDLKCPVCRKEIQVDLGSEAFYCRRCGKAFSTARCYYQQFDNNPTFFTKNNILLAYRDEKAEVTIPDSITTIGAGAFADNQTLESVTLPSTVRVIEPYAFANCRNLVSVTLPENLKLISVGAFADCVSLPKLKIPSGAYLERHSFLRCSALSLRVANTNSCRSAEHVGLSKNQVTYRTSGGCYITSAVCERRGEADDCEMLTRFRAFRDNWLVNQPGGAEDVQEYYRTAPAIVDAIHSNERCNDILDGIYLNYLKPCFDLLDKGDYLSCRQVYTQMVRDCEASYLMV